MNYTVNLRTYRRSYWNRIRQKWNYPCIDLPNGAKCNADFFWYCVKLGILSEDD